jgi:WD40 repeat protein
MSAASKEAFETGDPRPNGDIGSVRSENEASVHRFDAFISYSHLADRDLARSLERTLWKFGQPWYGLRGTRTYRDETDLSADPDLWGSIKRAVEQSRCLLLLASPASARSKWVSKEVAAAMAKHGRNAVCVLLTGGVLPETDGISPDSLSERVDGAMSEELWNLLDAGEEERFVIDLRPFRDMPETTRQRDAEYLSRVASVAAKALQREKQDIWGQFYRAQRLRGYFLASIAIVLLALSMGLGFTLRSAQLATLRAKEATKAEADQRAEAQRQRDAARESARLATEQRDNAEAGRLSVEAHRNDQLPADLRLLLTVEAYHTANNFVAREAMLSNLASNSQLLRYFHHPAAASDCNVATSPDGKMVATGDDGNRQDNGGYWGRVWLWSLNSRAAPLLLLGHKNMVRSVAFSPNGKLLASEDTSGLVILWDVTKSSPAAKILAPPEEGRDTKASIAFSPDGEVLAASFVDTVLLWNLKKLTAETLNAGTISVESVAFSSDSRSLAIAGTEGNTRIWSITSKSPVGEPLSTPAVTMVAFGAGGTILAAADRLGNIQLWDITSRHTQGTPLVGGTYDVNSISFSPDGKLLASSDLDGTARVWDVKSGRPVTQVLKCDPALRDPGYKSTVSDFAYLPENMPGVAFGWDSRTVFGGCETNVLEWALDGHNALRERPEAPTRGDIGEWTHAAFGRVVALTRSSVPGVWLWNIRDTQTIEHLFNKAKGLVAFSPTMDKLASSDGSIMLWDMRTRKRLV